METKSMTTSKEAIKRIKDDFEIKYDNLKNEKDRQNIIALCDAIENDLEVLEIIKKCPMSALFDYSKTYEEWCNDVCDVDIVKKYDFTKEKYDLVKQWTTNEL